MTQVVLSLGSNIDDRLGYLRHALTGLALHGSVQAVSGVYETMPWGDADQARYLNAVVLLTGAQTVEEWLEITQRLEKEAGRVRDPRRPFGPRTLDIDLIAAWDDGGEPVIRDTPELTLPHPRAHLRGFVLRPWLEIQPYARLAGHGWVNDLLLADDMTAEVSAMTARPDLSLESGA